MNTAPTLAAPEVGQLVRVRDRHWVVTNVVASSLAATGCEPSHLVELSSVEDDAFGDELTVFWEVEPGTVVLPKATLPQPSRTASTTRAASTRSSTRSAGARSRRPTPARCRRRSGSGIAIEDYQLDPVVRALQMPRVNLLIADDVGLGKTIEAGLVVQELLLRHRARTVLVVCPASLCLKWQAEMHDRFGLEFRIVDAEPCGSCAASAASAPTSWTSLPAADRLDRLAEGDRARWRCSTRCCRLTPRVYPRTFDLLIVDEVHHVRAGGARRVRHRLAAHEGDPQARAALRAPAVPVGDAAQRLHRELHGAARAARPAAVRARREAVATRR